MSDSGRHRRSSAHTADSAFFLVTVFCFANSSKKLHDWFVGTDIYKKNLESFVQKKGMTARTKAGIISSVTVLMGLGFFMMKDVPVGRVILAAVWVCHMIYFIFGVKTLKIQQKSLDFNEKP